MTRRLVAPADVVDIAVYEKKRPEFREHVLAEKERRRAMIGPNFTLLFENFETVLYQVQEMMRVERIVDNKAIAHEIETYNQLIPEPGTLSATLLIAYEDEQERAQVLPALLGIDQHVWLRVGDLPTVRARFDTAQIGEDRVSSVQYITFLLGSAQCKAWREAGARGNIYLATTHPAYTHEQVLPAALAEALAIDLGV